MRHLFLAGVCIIYVFPLYWTVNLSLQQAVTALRFPPTWFARPNFSAYVRVFERVDVGQLFLNSLAATSISLAIGIPSAILAAYSLVRFRYRGRKTLLLSILAMRMIPPIALVIPLFLLMGRYGLLDTRIGLGLAYAALNIPVVLWLLVGYLYEVPEELEQAALIDGCSRMGALWRVVVPIILPGVAAVAILAGIMAWSDFLLSYVLTRRHASTLPMVIPTFINEHSFELQQLSAYGVLVFLPAVIMGALAQRYLIKGLTMGALK